MRRRLARCQAYRWARSHLLTNGPNVDMLPFLKTRKLDSIVIAKQKPEGSINEDMPNDGLQAAMQDLHRAMKEGDYTAMARAIQSAFEICESEPHAEDPHEGEE